MKTKINDNHRRAFASALKTIEETLHEMAEIVASASEPAHPHFSPGQARDLLRRIDLARQQIEDFRRRFSIPVQKDTDPSWAIQVRVSRLWETLENCKSARLRGYGEVTDSAKPILDSEVQKLIDILQDIAVTARK